MRGTINNIIARASKIEQGAIRAILRQTPKGVSFNSEVLILSLIHFAHSSGWSRILHQSKMMNDSVGGTLTPVLLVDLGRFAKTDFSNRESKVVFS